MSLKNYVCLHLYQNRNPNLNLSVPIEFFHFFLSDFSLSVCLSVWIFFNSISVTITHQALAVNVVRTHRGITRRFLFLFFNECPITLHIPVPSEMTCVILYVADGIVAGEACASPKHSQHKNNNLDARKADHEVLNEENESRLQHCYAVVVQDISSQWIQSYPTKSKAAQETMKCLQKFAPPDQESCGTHTDISRELCWDHDRVNPLPIRNQRVERRIGAAAGK